VHVHLPKSALALHVDLDDRVCHRVVLAVAVLGVDRGIAHGALWEKLLLLFIAFHVC
jgi:hypothetical protein